MSLGGRWKVIAIPELGGLLEREPAKSASLLLDYRNNSHMNATSRTGIGRMDRRLSVYATLAGVVLATPAIETADAIYCLERSGEHHDPGDYSCNLFECGDRRFQFESGTGPWMGRESLDITTLNFFTPRPNPGGGEMVGTGTTYFSLAPGFVCRARQHIRNSRRHHD